MSSTFLQGLRCLVVDMFSGAMSMTGVQRIPLRCCAFACGNHAAEPGRGHVHDVKPLTKSGLAGVRSRELHICRRVVREPSVGLSCGDLNRHRETPRRTGRALQVRRSGRLGGEPYRRG